MEKTDIIICLKKKTKTKRISKNYCEAKKSQSNNSECMLCSLVIKYLC